LLVDAFGRPLTDLRISVTERCNFKCVYCHNEGQGQLVKPPHAAHADEMTPSEVENLVRVASELGVNKVKLTGGEPLVREDLEEIVRRISPFVEVSLTTNGSMLEHRAANLRAAGLARCNVSLDSLTPKEFEDIRGGQLAPVLRGIHAALDAGLKPLKVNLVVYQHTVKNIPSLIDYVGAADGLRLQLIQFMPEMAWQHPFAVDIATVRSFLEAQADRVAERRLHRRKRYRIRGAWVEIVDPVNNPEFCLSCHRVRVTHDGHLKGCINVNSNLVATRGLDDEGLRAAFRRVVAERAPFYRPPAPSGRAPMEAVAQ
jgi:cyclic pyranopterin phosphate synthase